MKGLQFPNRCQLLGRKNNIKLDFHLNKYMDGSKQIVESDWLKNLFGTELKIQKNN